MLNKRCVWSFTIQGRLKPNMCTFFWLLPQHGIHWWDKFKGSPWRQVYDTKCIELLRKPTALQHFLTAVLTSLLFMHLIVSSTIRPNYWQTWSYGESIFYTNANCETKQHRLNTLLGLNTKNSRQNAKPSASQAISTEISRTPTAPIVTVSKQSLNPPVRFKSAPRGGDRAVAHQV